MVPLTLSLKNFLSYGPQTQTVTFEPYTFICLCGRNGHGKSALLDAMTWAIWGHARKISNQAKSDDILLHLGETTMMVCFEFIINQNKYRIRREYSYTKGKPSSTLDFGIYDATHNTVQSLSEKTIRQTQEKINTILGFTYETFCNSIFLKQGASGEFSKKTPKERKDILCQLLNVDYYEALHKKALEKQRELSTQHTTLMQQAQNIINNQDTCETIEKKIEEYIIQEKNSIEQHTAIIQQEETIKETITTLTVTIQKLEESKQQKQSLNKIYQENKAEIQTLFNKTHRNKVGIYKNNREELQKNAEQFQQKAALAHTLEKKIAELSLLCETRKKELLQQQLQEKDTANTLLRTLSAHHARIYNQWLTVQKAIQEKTEQKEALEKQLSSLPEPIATLPNIQQQFERTKQFYHHLISRGQNTKKQYDTLEAEYIMLNNLESVCHTCKQPLPEKQKDIIKKKLYAKKNRLERHIKKIKQFLIQLKEELTTMHNRITLLQTGIQHPDKITALEKEIISITAEYQTLSKASQEIEEQIKQQELFTQKIETILKEEQYITTDRAYTLLHTDLIATQKEYASLEYDAQTHQKIITAYSAVMNMTDQLHQRNIIREKIKHTRIIKQQLLLCSYSEETYTKLLLQKNEQEACLAALITQKRNTLYEQEIIQSKKNNLIHQRDLLVMHLEEQKKLLIRCEDLKREIEEYSALAQALGKDGIQAVLIENAIPELEAEANELLARLTDNQTYLNIESVRDLKSGKTKETLDITISDTIGTRSYELFSGGEAFRIDFALRIALAKLLARRSGTTLQTLIIDEGFGSQDDEGLQRIVDALYKIQDDFSKIIIVSHLPQLKNQFSTHFIVTKEARGSIITIAQS